MKNTLSFLSLIAGAAVLFAAPETKQLSPAKEKKQRKDTTQPVAKSPVAGTKSKPAATKAAASIPQKEVPEKKMPYELWLNAHSAAVKAADAGKYAEALKLFDEAIKSGNQPSMKNYSLYGKAAALISMKKYAEAAALLQTPVHRNRNTPYHQARVRLMCGEILLIQKKYDDAAKEFRKAADLNSSPVMTAEAFISLGKIAELRKNYSAAQKYYETLINDETTLPGIRGRGVLAVAGMLQAQKKFKQAFEYLNHHRNIEQLPAESVMDMAFLGSELKIAMQDLKGAYQQLRDAESVRGRSASYSAQLYTNMAKVLFLQKRFYDARNMINRSKSIRGREWGYDSKLHSAINKEIARIERERKARLERERKAKIERERKAKLERERKAKIERERKAKLEKKRKAEIEKQKKSAR